jgi:Uma2 family endonuclease
VVSPSTAALDRVQKMPVYGRAAVAFAWLVDPRAKTLEVFRWHGDHWGLSGTYAEASKVRAEPFEAVELDLARWWLEES